VLNELFYKRIIRLGQLFFIDHVIVSVTIAPDLIRLASLPIGGVTGTVVEFG
jgi:hypothetical protein